MKNSLGIVARYAHITALAAYTFSPQDSGVFLAAIPAGTPGTTLNLPAEPNEGDMYSFADTDGSCNEAHFVALVPAAGGTTVNGGGTHIFAFSRFSGYVVFDAAADNWVLYESATGDEEVTLNAFSTNGNGGPVTPGALTLAAATPVLVAAVGMTPKGVGLTEVAFMLTLTLAAADTVTMRAAVQANVTSITGGSELGGASPSFNYETGQGAGQPVVVVGGAVTQQGSFVESRPAGALTVTCIFAGAVELPAVTVAGAVSAILLDIATTGGADISALSLSAFGQEVS